MQAIAHLFAFRDNGAKRTITIPDDEVQFQLTPEGVADLAYKYGQNDFQPQQCRSVCVDDVVELELVAGHRLFFKVSVVGFVMMSPKEVASHGIS